MSDDFHISADVVVILDVVSVGGRLKVRKMRAVVACCHMQSGLQVQ